MPPFKKTDLNLSLKLNSTIKKRAQGGYRLSKFLRNYKYSINNQFVIR